MNSSTKEDNRTEKRKRGDFGEEIACRYLEKKGYKILERNFLCKIGELDIIAFEPVSKTIAIVEVKTRNSIAYGYPSEFVNKAKQNNIKKTTLLYLMQNPGFKTLPLRMDILEVLILGKEVFVRHIPNAF